MMFKCFDTQFGKSLNEFLIEFSDSLTAFRVTEKMLKRKNFYFRRKKKTYQGKKVCMAILQTSAVC